MEGAGEGGGGSQSQKDSVIKCSRLPRSTSWAVIYSYEVSQPPEGDDTDLLHFLHDNLVKYVSSKQHHTNKTNIS